MLVVDQSQVSSSGKPAAESALPSVAEFLRAMEEYRCEWPADGYKDSEHRFVQTYRLLRAYLHGDAILDVGGWPGDLAIALRKLKLDICVVDRDPTRPTIKVFDPVKGRYVLEGATTLTEKCCRYGTSVVACDIERQLLPFADQSQDFLIFTEVIEHLRTGLLPALRELFRVLRPGGRMLLSTPNLLSLQNRVSFALGRASYDTLQMPYEALAAEEHVGHSGHFRVFSMPELLDLLERVGFRVLHREYQQLIFHQGYPRSLYGAKLLLRDKLASLVRPLGNTIFLVAERP